MFQSQHSRAISILAVCLMLVTSACTTMSVQEDEVASIRRLAIVGFEGRDGIDTSTSNSRVASGSSTLDTVATATMTTADVLEGLSHDNLGVHVQAGTFAYDQLVQSLQEALSADVLTRDELVGNDFYKRDFESRMAWLIDRSTKTATADDKSWISFTMVEGPSTYDKAFPLGVIWTSYIEDMKPDERDAYMDDLGVDAIAWAYVRWYTAQVDHPQWFSPIEVTQVHRPALRTELWVYKRGVEEPIWYDKGAEGCPSPFGIKTTMGVRDDSVDMLALMNSATSLGYRRLVDRMREATHGDGSIKESGLENMLSNGCN